nr:hypothetical protein [Vibrio mimicus]
MAVKASYVKFLFAGAIGFLVDCISMYILLYYIGPFLAKIVSFLLAVITTWLINRKFTFGREKRRSISKEFFLYLSSMLFGGAVNFLVFSLFILIYGSENRGLFIAMCLGTVSALCLNYFSSSRIVFNKS